MFYLIDKNDGLSVKSILYFINYKMVIVVLNLYLREKSLLIGQNGVGGKLWIAVCVFCSLKSP